jgi:hypothetical protein
MCMSFTIYGTFLAPGSSGVSLGYITIAQIATLVLTGIIIGHHGESVNQREGTRQWSLQLDEQATTGERKYGIQRRTKVGGGNDGRNHSEQEERLASKSQSRNRGVAQPESRRRPPTKLEGYNSTITT